MSKLASLGSGRQDMLACKNRLIESHKQCSEIYAETQKKVSGLLAQVSSASKGATKQTFFTGYCTTVVITLTKKLYFLNDIRGLMRC